MKTSELTGPALDWAVAKCEHPNDTIIKEEIDLHLVSHAYPYSTDWSQGGPIIDREGITTGPWDTSPARAIKGHNHDYKPTYTMVGPTPLIAAMRCFCCSKLGDEIDIPEELCQQQKS